MFEAVSDIRLSLDGDLVVDRGTLALTTGIDWYKREVNKRLRSGSDWYHHPNLGANIGEFIGHPNTRETGQRIRNRVSHSLSSGNIHLPAQLEIQVVPVSLHQIQLFVVLLNHGERNLISHEVIDFDRGLVRDIPDPLPNQEPIGSSPYKAQDNPYLNRMGRR